MDNKIMTSHILTWNFCPICHSEDIEVIENHPQDILKNICRCNNCTHAFRQNVEQQIKERYFEKNYWNMDKARQGIHDITPSKEWQRWVNARINILESFHLLDYSNPEEIEILEFGCAEGMLLYELKRRGYRVMGNEVGAVADEASKKLGIDINRDPIESFAENDRKFDLIMSFHVVEHLIDPLTVMTSLAKMLKPNGQILMHVPIDDMEFTNYDHYHFFTPISCRYLMQQISTSVRSDIHYYYPNRTGSPSSALAATFVGSSFSSDAGMQFGESISLQERQTMREAIPEIRALMADEQSVKLYDARLRYYETGNEYEFIRTAIPYGKEWLLPDLDRAVREMKVSCVLLWGCGEIGRLARMVLAESIYKDLDVMFVSNTSSRWGTSIELTFGGRSIKTPVISPAEVTRYHKEGLLLILSKSGKTDIMDEISNMYVFPMHRILWPRQFFGYHLLAYCGKQYFDVFSPRDNEVFLDVGCYDGITSLSFREWCNRKYEKIVAFEPNDKMAKLCEEKFKREGMDNTDVITKAAWSKSGEFNFWISNEFAQGGSRIVAGESGMTCSAETIDNVLNGERASFIKMDVEGAEYQALLGAKQTIQQYHPRLAISLYHKPEDILEIPYLIHRINPNYRFKIRHYTAFWTETVLYAFEE